jgi:PadR family transcriptional regulator, regulatory protein PadR
VDKQVDLLQGTLHMLIKAVSLGPLHGYSILLRIQRISKDRLEIQQGSLHPALYRLEHQGWISSEWGVSENKRKAKYDGLTAAVNRRFPNRGRKVESDRRQSRVAGTGPEQTNLWKSEVSAVTLQEIENRDQWLAECFGD